MRVDIELMRDKMKKAKLTQAEVAEKICVDKSTFSRKMQNQGESFSIGEMHKIVDILDLSKEEAQQIFLA